MIYETLHLLKLSNGFFIKLVLVSCVGILSACSGPNLEQEANTRSFDGDQNPTNTITENSTENEENNGQGAQKNEDPDDDAIIAIPEPVAGAYLVCQSMDNVKDKSKDKYVARMGCLITSNDKDSPLAIKKKKSEASHKFVDEKFAFKLASNNKQGASSFERAPVGSPIDYIIDVESQTLRGLKSYLDSLNVNVIHKTSETDVEDPSTIKEDTKVAGMFVALADMVGGKVEKINLVEAKSAFSLKQPKKLYEVPGKIDLDGTVKLLTEIKFPKKYPGVVNNIYTAVTIDKKLWGFGEFNAPHATQVSGTSNSLFKIFGEDHAEIITSNSDSAFYSAKVGPDDRVYVVGRENLNGSNGVTEDKYNGSITIFNKDGTYDSRGHVGQAVSDEFFYGLDFEGDSYVVAVGQTRREGMLGPKGGYIAVIDIKNGQLPYHQWISTVGNSQTFNAVSVRKDGKYLIAGQVRRENCDQYDGWIVLLDRSKSTPTEAIEAHKILGLGNNDSFNRITTLDNGDILVEGVMDLTPFQAPNEKNALSGPQSVYIYLDTTMNVKSAVLKDGTNIELTDFTSQRSCN